MGIMLKNQDIVCFSTLDWDDHWTSKQQIMFRLSNNNRIIYIEPFISIYGIIRLRRYRKRLFSWFKGMKEVKDNLYVFTPPPFLPFNNYFAVIRWINKCFLMGLLKVQLKRLKFSKIILWIYEPRAVDFIGGFKEQLVCYHCTDEHSAVPGEASSLIEQIEKRLLLASDIVFASSPVLYHRKKPFNKNIHFVPNAADVTHFSKALSKETPVPSDIASIKKPIIGLVGTMDQRLDVELLEKLAISHSDWSIVLIGEIKKEMVDVTCLKDIKNVYFLGRKRLEDLPHYLKAVDVALIPYKINKLTRGIYPLKLHEYLASGRSVVATDLPSLREFEKVIKIARNQEQFISYVSQALRDNSPALIKERSELAKHHTWEKRIEKFSTLLKPLMADENHTKLTNILHITCVNEKIYAIEGIIQMLADKLDKQKFKMTVACPPGPLVAELRKSNTRVYEVKMGSKYNLGAIYHLVRIMKMEKVDIVHTHQERSLLFGLIAAKIARIPKIIQTDQDNSISKWNEGYWRKNRRILPIQFGYSFLAKFATGFIAVSEATKRFLVKIRNISPDKITIIYNEVELDKFMSSKLKKSEVRIKLGLEKEQPVVGVVARLTIQKGHKYLLDASKEIIKKFPEVKFLFVGDGILMQELNSYVKTLGVEKWVQFLGYRKDVAQLMTVFDISVLPSLWEGCPLVPLESMACGIPVVATGLDGTAEIIKDGATGILVPAKNPEELSRAILTLLEDKERAKKMAKAAREYVEANFSSEIFIKRISEFYEDLLKGKT